MLKTINVCASGPRLIFSCSGAADVGEIADQVARKLTREGVASMSCTAGIGGALPGMIETAKAADKIIALDGCTVSCVKCLLEKGGVANIEHVRITDLGFVKGKTAVDEINIGRVCAAVKERLHISRLEGSANALSGIIANGSLRER